MLISQEQIEQVRQSCDIVKMAGQLTRLQEKNNTLLGRCPLCNDKGESLGVKGEKQLYYCFNCKRGGDAISFYRDTKRYYLRNGCKRIS